MYVSISTTSKIMQGHQREDGWIGVPEWSPLVQLVERDVQEGSYNPYALRNQQGECAVP